MPRRALGDRPLTPAERQAHQRAKHRAQYEDLVMALREIAARAGYDRGAEWCRERAKAALTSANA